MTTPVPRTSDATIDTIARELLTAYTTRAPLAPIRERVAADDVEAAYQIQQRQIRAWLDRGRRIVGRKIGLTSKAVQQQLGVDQPDYGTLLDDMQLPSGARVPASRLIQPKIEAEIALGLARDLDSAELTLEAVRGAVAWVAPALEIVDSRIANWNIRLVDTIADNASSGLFVLGEPRHELAGFDFEGCGMALRRGTEVVSRGEGRACLGNPLIAAQWLASRMSSLGTPLRAGDVIMSGALGPMVTANSGDRFDAHIDGLGSVHVTFG